MNNNKREQKYKIIDNNIENISIPQKEIIQPTRRKNNKNSWEKKKAKK